MVAPHGNVAVSFERDRETRRISDVERTRLLSTLRTGAVHTEHMALLDWNSAEGWHDGRIVAYAPLALDPATSVLHYGHSVFEGMKAFRQADGGVAIFRAFDHAMAPWLFVVQINVGILEHQPPMGDAPSE